MSDLVATELIEKWARFDNEGVLKRPGPKSLCRFSDDAPREEKDTQDYEAWQIVEAAIRKMAYPDLVRAMLRHIYYNRGAWATFHPIKPFEAILTRSVSEVCKAKREADEIDSTRKIAS